MTWDMTDMSLCQFHGITLDLERSMHNSGIINGESLLRYLALHGPKSLLSRVTPSVALFLSARQLQMIDVMLNLFPVGTRVRILKDRYEKSLFLDVETSGRGTSAAITMISTCLNGTERTFVRGIDLLEFLPIWNDAEIIVSFNGKRFDIPVIMHEFGISRVPAHIDLMDEARHFGLKGGLKEIEKKIGFKRNESNCKNGIDAIEIWQNYISNKDKNSLATLKCYNRDDTRSLTALYRYLLPLALEGITSL